ncbi:MAG: YlxM family DNA-binding protein [bacterium]
MFKVMSTYELDLLEVTLLYDFYGELLTTKQKEIFELYYFNDYSLSEISSQYNISRQAILDTIRRSEKSILRYENTLGLVKKHKQQKQVINASILNLNYLSNLKEFNNNTNINIINDIINNLNNLNI